MTERSREQPALTPIVEVLADLQGTSRWQKHVYRQLRAHPELSFQESKTAALAASKGARKPMLMGCAITAAGILLTTFTFLLARQYMIVASVGFTLFGIGLGFYATPSTDAALSNVPDDKAS